jgi:hypothetical protein
MDRGGGEFLRCGRLLTHQGTKHIYGYSRPEDKYVLMYDHFGFLMANFI